MRDLLAFWGWAWDLSVSHLVGVLAAVVVGVVLFFGGAAVTYGIDQLHPLSADWASVLIILPVSLGAIAAYLWPAVRVYGRHRRARQLQSVPS